MYRKAGILRYALARIRRLAASAGVWPRATESEITAALWAIVVWKGL